MFEMVREIEDIPVSFRIVIMFILHNKFGCQASVLSSHRSFISRFDVVEINTATGKGSKVLSVALFLFSDSMEVSNTRQRYQ